ncbi:DUF6059 family protein [Actinacidiphila paucisporea]|nr:DUF6059 family protein [Actinacidiphila paucisporea]
MRRISRWLLRQLTAGLGSLAMFWFHMPDPELAYPELPSPASLDGPPAGHPERMCREIPLTRTELMLMAEIDAIGDSGR